MEVVGSKKKGNFSLAINAKMFDTTLTDKVTSNVLNEIQEVEISSVITMESYVCFFC